MPQNDAGVMIRHGKDPTLGSTTGAYAFIEILDCDLKAFSDDHVPLHKTKESRTTKYCVIVLDRSAIGENTRKRRSHGILNDF